MIRLRLLIVACVLVIVVVGCGGPEEAVAPPTPPDDGDGAAPMQVGPLVVRPASAAGFVAEAVATGSGPVTLVAMHGSRINYLASQALLDRIVFARGSGLDFDICVCNLDGSGAVKLIDNTAADEHPAWSPDGRRIAFQRDRPVGDADIVVMNADGSNPVALTANTFNDRQPAWSPEGRRIAFNTNRDGDDEIYLMYDDGSGAVNLTNAPGSGETFPTWSRYTIDRPIFFESNRDAGDLEIYRMQDDGSGQTRVTNNPGWDGRPAASAISSRVAWERTVQGAVDIVVGGSAAALYNLSAAPSPQQYPAWSSDERFIAYCEPFGGNYELVLQQVDPPYDRFVLPGSPAQDVTPDLGSPTMQTDRVIIGPSGSDWGGRNPIWSSADAGIAAYDDKGYRSFVRVAVRQADLPSLKISPLTHAAAPIGGVTAGVLVEANEIVSLREDAGRGRASVLWQLDPLDATAVVLYFSTWTGKLVAVLTIADQNYPTGTGSGEAAVHVRAEGGAMLVEGVFGAVFDATGARIADAASAVSIGSETVSVVR